MYVYLIALDQIFLSRGHPTGICEFLSVVVATCQSEFKNRRFWATHGNRKSSFFSFNMRQRYHICVAECFYSYRDDLPKNLFKVTAQECKKSTSCWRSSLKNSLTLFGSSALTRTRCPIWKWHVVGVAEVQSNDKVFIHDRYPSSLRKQQHSLLGVDYLAPVSANSIRCKIVHMHYHKHWYT